LPLKEDKMETRKIYKRTRTDSGFTLVELLLVIIILGILGGIAVPMFLGQRTKAMQSEARANLESLRLLEEQFFAENGRYAPWPNKANPNSVGTTNYTESSTDVLTDLPGFRPGDASDLNFDYSLVSLVNGTEFTATAVGKAGTPVEGTTFSIDQDNVRNF
jgi:prepilin-type N-terminal cleavage/methylation domain-containing protein